MRSGSACAMSSRPPPSGRERSPSAAERGAPTFSSPSSPRELGADLLLLLALPVARVPGQLRQASATTPAGGRSGSTGCSNTRRWRSNPSGWETPPAGMDVFSRTNLWILDTARVEAVDGGFADDPGLGREADRRRAGRNVRLRREGRADEQPIRDRESDETGGVR